MIYFYFFSAVFFVCVLIFALYTRKYANPYKLIMVFGKKGSGKTTLMSKLILKDLKHGVEVYCNSPVTVKDRKGQIAKFDNFHLFSVHELLISPPPAGSHIYIDEVGLIWNNRDFKSFNSGYRDYFKFQRQLKHKVYLFSQTFDVDIQIRNMCDYMYMCTCKMNVFSLARKIKRGLTIVNPDGEHEARIADSLEFEPLILQLFGCKSIMLTFIPHWIRYFDTAYLSKKKYKELEKQKEGVA